MKNVEHENEKAISGAIKIDEKEIRDHLDGLVRQSVEDTLKGTSINWLEMKNSVFAI